MVQLTVTPVAKVAIDEYGQIRKASNGADQELTAQLERLTTAGLGGPIEHHDLVQISKYLVKHEQIEGKEDYEKVKRWRLDKLLKGAAVYHPPPPPKPEPTSEYKALMQRLKKQEEQRQYELMVHAPQHETFSQRFPNAPTAFNPATSHGQGPQAEEPDDMTFADVNRQMILIINVLVSIIACSVTIWFAARRWDVPQRLGLSMSGSGIVALAEVAIYFGYIRRLQEAKDKEVKKVEQKEIVETWVIDKSVEPLSVVKADATSVRHRKGKHP